MSRKTSPPIDFTLDVESIEEAPQPYEHPSARKPHASTLSMLPLIERAMDDPGKWFRVPIPKAVQNSMSSRITTIRNYLELPEEVLEYRTRSERDRFGRETVYLYVKAEEMNGE